MTEDAARLMLDDKTFKKLLEAAVITSLSDETKTAVIGTSVEKVIQDKRTFQWAVEQAVKGVLVDLVKKELLAEERQDHLKSIVTEAVDASIVKARKEWVERVAKAVGPSLFS